MITLSINLSKIDKARIIEGKNGAKYINVVVWDKDTDSYGNNLSVQQSLSKEERENKVKPIYIGDGKDWDKVVAPQQTDKPTTTTDDDNLPF